MTPALGILRMVGSGLLTAGSAVGVLLLGAMVVGSFSGVRLVVITSGSMEPGIETGALVLTRHVSASDLRVADVVMVTTPTGSRVTHRIVGIERSGDEAVLRLKGDANDTADAEPYRVTAADRAVLDVPVAGRVLGWAGSPGGLLSMGALAAALLVVVLGGGSGPADRDGKRHRPPAGRRRAGVPAAAVALAVAVTAPVPPISSSAASWTDDAAIGGSAFRAHTVPATTLSCGALGVASVTFSWTAVPGATSYTLHYGTNGASTLTTPSTSQVITSLVSGGTAWVTVNRSFGSVVWRSVDSNARGYTVAVVSLCG